MAALAPKGASNISPTLAGHKQDENSESISVNYRASALVVIEDPARSYSLS